MSDEEKKALEILKDREYDFDELYVTFGQSFIKPYDKSIGIILELIEKQSKEIEELKDRNKKLKDKARELIFEKQELSSALLDSTPNDKIKAKIEDILNSENGEAIEKLIQWQSLLEKE